MSPQDPLFRVVCYFTNWSQYRRGLGKFTPENIDPFLCTHLIYAFAFLKNGELRMFEKNDESKPCSFNLSQFLGNKFLTLKID